MTVGGPRGINTPRSRTVTVIFQSSEPPRKLSKLPNSETSADCSPYTSEIKLGTSEHRNNRGKTAVDLSFQ
jgi:hypothetical protein